MDKNKVIAKRFGDDNACIHADHDESDGISSVIYNTNRDGYIY